MAKMRSKMDKKTRELPELNTRRTTPYGDGVDDFIKMPKNKKPVLAWERAWEKTPKGIAGANIDVIVRLVGLASFTASEYEEYKVVKWSEKRREFGEFVRDYKGDIVYKSYKHGNQSEMNCPYKSPFITHWAYFDIPDFCERYGY